MNKNEFKEILKELLEDLEEDSVQEKKFAYSPREFISHIMSYGGVRYNHGACVSNGDEIYEAIGDLLTDALDLPYVSVRAQDFCIAIASPKYIEDAKNTCAKVLRIIPEVFTEVSGPMSTVLIIDCEKQFLRKAYLGIGEDEWQL